jgi:serine/threonine protein kinase
VLFTVSEFLENGTVYDYIEETGKLPVQVARLLFAQLITGLKHIHQNGLAHRDLKWDNVLLNGQI